LDRIVVEAVWVKEARVPIDDAQRRGALGVRTNKDVLRLIADVLNLNVDRVAGGRAAAGREVPRPRSSSFVDPNNWQA
jgi:hypothetical protein